MSNNHQQSLLKLHLSIFLNFLIVRNKINFHFRHNLLSSISYKKFNKTFIYLYSGSRIFWHIVSKRLMYCKHLWHLNIDLNAYYILYLPSNFICHFSNMPGCILSGFVCVEEKYFLKYPVFIFFYPYQAEFTSKTHEVNKTKISVIK